MGRVDKILINHSEDLKNENSQLKEDISSDHAPSFDEGIRATASAAAVGGAIYLLTNNADLPAPFAAVDVVSAAKGISSLVYDYNSGKITFDEFI